MSEIKIPSMTHLLDNTHKRRAIRNLYKMMAEGGGSGGSGGSSGGGGGVTPIETSELKTLRDNGQLTPGALYRITDYVTTCTKTAFSTSETTLNVDINVRCLTHPFDIIVMALTEDTLSEDAWAAHSERDTEVSSFKMGDGSSSSTVINNYSTGEYNGELYYEFLITSSNFPVYLKSLSETPTTSTVFLLTNNSGPCFINQNPNNIQTIEQQGATYVSDVIYGYFGGSNLSAWKLKYCLDNDTDRFAWADTTNGKGVIYRLTDEFDNSLPYDFKNIQFEIPLEYYHKVFSYQYHADSVQCKKRWCYIFGYCNGGFNDNVATVPCVDASLNTTPIIVKNNYVGYYTNINTSKLEIPFICFTTSKYGVSDDTQCYTLMGNYIEDMCTNIIYIYEKSYTHICSGCNGIFEGIYDNNWAMVGTSNQYIGCPFEYGPSSSGGRT